MIDQNFTGSSLENPSKKIKLLPEHLIDQIKAGEVIERPSSLIKEIIENSLDANSTEISLHLINNGLDLIAIEDDGDGMKYEDLPYAFCRHATSKISRFEDLYSLNSFGFRGEALASICSIARVTCTSAQKENDPQGGKIVFHAGNEEAHERQENLKKGTALYIKDLFFNTPARLKFIKSAQSEKNSLKRVIDSFIIANPHVKFVIRWDDLDKEIYPPCAQASQRTAKLFQPKKKSPDVYSFSGEYEGHKVWGFLSQNSTKGNAHKKHFLFGNSRLFTDRQIHQTILRSAERLYPHGESGHYCVFIDVPESMIDVNVHPNKTQIKFFKLSVITSLLSSEIKKVTIGHEQHDLIEQIEYPRPSQSPSVTSTVGTTPLFNHNKHEDSLKPQQVSAPANNSEFQVIPGNPTYLLNKNALILNIQNKISHHQDEERSDLDFIPLMICEPLDINHAIEEKSHFIKELERIGLLCDFLDEKTLVLRGHHQVYQGLRQFHLLALALVTQLINNELDLSHFHFDHSWCLKLIKLYPNDYKKFLIPLDCDFIERSFKK